MKEEKKLEILEKSFEEGIIKKKEYKKQKKKLKNKIKKEEKIEEKKEEIPESRISEKILFFSIIGIIIIFAAIFSIRFFNKEEIKTIDDLHRLNLQGKIKPEQGYIYKQFSFVLVDNLWYTQVKAGNVLIDIPLHYGPRDVEDIPITGKFDIDLFNSMPAFYITFDPLGSGLQYVALAIGEFDQNMIKVFGKMPVAACDKNETKACQTRPIITCENMKTRPVIYVKEEDETKIILDGNCLIVQGRGLEIVRAMDKVILVFYGIS